MLRLEKLLLILIKLLLLVKLRIILIQQMTITTEVLLKLLLK